MLLLAAIILTVLGFFLISTPIPIHGYDDDIKIKIYALRILKFILSFGLIGGGVYCFLNINYLTSLISIASLLVLLSGYIYMQSRKRKARKILAIYKHLSQYQSLYSEKIIFDLTTRIYLEKMGWKTERIETLIIFNIDNKEYSNIKDFIKTILKQEIYPPFFGNIHEGFSNEAEYESREIETALDKVLEKYSIKNIRPILNNSEREFLMEVGRNPDEMSNDELKTWLKIGKSQNLPNVLVTKIMYFISTGFAISIVINLFSKWSFLFTPFIMITLIIASIGYRFSLSFARKRHIKTTLNTLNDKIRLRKYKNLRLELNIND